MKGLYDYLHFKRGALSTSASQIGKNLGNTICNIEEIKIVMNIELSRKRQFFYQALIKLRPMKTIAYYDQIKHNSYDSAQLLGQMINVSLASCQGLRNR